MIWIMIKGNEKPYNVAIQKNYFFLKKKSKSNNLLFLWVIEGYFSWSLFMETKDTEIFPPLPEDTSTYKYSNSVG